MTDKKDNVLDVFQVKLLENYDIDDYWQLYLEIMIKKWKQDCIFNIYKGNKNENRNICTNF